MADCYDKLTAGISLLCGNKLQAGLRDRVILINWDDVDFDNSTVNSANNKIVEDIVFKTASPSYKGYGIEGFKYSNELELAYAPGRFTHAFEPTINVRIFDNDPDVKERIQEMINSKLIVLTERVYQNTAGDSVFELWGWDAALEVKNVVMNVSDADMKGGYIITIGANEIVKPQYVGYTFFNTDLAITRAKVDALLV